MIKNGNRNEDYYAWNQPILAQADGVVLTAEDRKPDLFPRQSGSFADANGLAVNYGGGIVGFYAHIQRGSLTVKVGDHVQLGQTLARVGNSGSSG